MQESAGKMYKLLGNGARRLRLARLAWRKGHSFVTTFVIFIK